MNSESLTATLMETEWSGYLNEDICRGFLCNSTDLSVFTVSPYLTSAITLSVLELPSF